MGKIMLLVFLLLFCKTTFCQVVIIDEGVDKNRLLTWDDFNGNPDNESPHAAMTYSNLSYSYTRVYFNFDTVKFVGLSVKLQFNKSRSWVKPGKKKSDLLKHEQGHFYIALLCQREMIQLFDTTVFFKADYKEKLKVLFNTMLEKVHLTQQWYDEQTNHSRNIKNQEKWDAFFTKMFP